MNDKEKNCSTCIHWKDPNELPEKINFIKRDEFKICSRQQVRNIDDSMEAIAASWDCDEIYLAISTGPNFKCKHYLSRRSS